MINNKLNIKAIILAGGKGSRLGSLTKLTPKPLLKVYKKEFIYYVIKYLKYNGIDDFIITTNYKKKLFNKYFDKKKINNIKIIQEKKVLGTGGSFLNVLKREKNNKKYYYLLCNADTLLMFNISKIYTYIKKYKKCILAIKKKNCERYGKLLIRNGYLRKIIKNNKKSGYISSGVFIFDNIDPNIFENKSKKLNFENDIINRMIEKRIMIRCLKINKPFIDIGTKKDFKNSFNFIKKNFLKKYELH